MSDPPSNTHSTTKQTAANLTKNMTPSTSSTDASTSTPPLAIRIRIDRLLYRQGCIALYQSFSVQAALEGLLKTDTFKSLNRGAAGTLSELPAQLMVENEAIHFVEVTEDNVEEEERKTREVAEGLYAKMTDRAWEEWGDDFCGGDWVEPDWE